MVKTFITKMSFWLCLIGGLSLVGIALLTVINIIGRSLIPIGLRPIPGDLELVQFLVAFSIFNFLPWCQLYHQHITVDVFYKFLPHSLRIFSNFFIQGITFLFSLIITWQLWQGLQDLKQHGELSFILQIPLWWGYFLVLPGALAFFLVSLYQFYNSLIDY